MFFFMYRNDIQNKIHSGGIPQIGSIFLDEYFGLGYVMLRVEPLEWARNRGKSIHCLPYFYC